MAADYRLMIRIPSLLLSFSNLMDYFYHSMHLSWYEAQMYPTTDCTGDASQSMVNRL